MDQGWVYRTGAVGVLAIASCGRIGYDPLGVGPEGGAADSMTMPPSISGGDGAVGDDADSAIEPEGASGTGSDSSAPSVDGAAEAGLVDAAGDADARSNDAALVEAGTVAVNVTDPSAWVLSGTAQVGTGELDVTPGTRQMAGGAYLPQPYSIGVTTSFTVAFSFRVYGSSGQAGNGFVLLWQNDPRGTAALGGAGGQLGLSGITPSVDVEFVVFPTTYNPTSDEVGITTNGQYQTYLSYGGWPTMDSGNTQYVWVAYDESTKTLSVSLSTTPTRPSTPLVSATVDLYATVGSSAYLGFVGSCGVANEVAAIQSLTVTYGR